MALGSSRQLQESYLKAPFFSFFRKLVLLSRALLPDGPNNELLSTPSVWTGSCRTLDAHLRKHISFAPLLILALQ